MLNYLVLIVALCTFASYTSASAQAKPAAVVRQAHSPSTLTLIVTLSPSAPGAPTPKQTQTITLNPTYGGGPAFTAQQVPPVPDDTPACASMDALVGSCTTLASFYVLPLSAQAQCLCNVGPWDAVVTGCFDHLTVLGQYYASSITSHGLLGLCSSLGLGPSNTAITTSSSVPTAETSSIFMIDNSTFPVPSTTINATQNTTPETVPNRTQSETQSSTRSTTQSAASSSGSFSLARHSVIRLVIFLAVGAVASF